MADITVNTGRKSPSAGGGGAYGLAVIGALVYFIRSADSFLDGVWGVIQALLWPAFLVYGLLDHLSL